MRNFETTRTALDFLEWEAPTLALEGKETVRAARHFVRFLTTDSKFSNGVASVSRHANSRHRERGGLAIHTAEVVSWVLHLAQGTPLDKTVLLFAAAWHDYGKIHEYRQKQDYTWEKVPEVLEKTGHPYLSAKKFQNVNSQYLRGPEYLNDKDDFYLRPHQIDHIEHCILSHHGRIEWGAIKEPATPEALLLHAADMMSSRFLPPV